MINNKYTLPSFCNYSKMTHEKLGHANMTFMGTV